MRQRRLTTERTCWSSLIGCCVALAYVGISHAADSAPSPTEASTQSSAEPSFDVEAYDVDGAAILPQVEIEKAVYAFMGPGRTRDDVEHARAALEKAYHDRGYQSVVVEVPAQTVADSVVRLHVVEAAVGRLRVTGSRYFSPDFIRTQTPALKEGQVPDFNAAQKQLADVNRLGDRRVTPLLRAGQAPGTVDVDLKVSDTLPVHGSVELNNDHSPNTDPLRLVATMHYDNLWQLGHSASFTYSVSPTNRSNSEVFAGSYLAPLWTTPVSLLVYGYHSNSNVAAIGGIDVLGKGYTIGARAIIQLPNLGSYAESLSAGVDFKHNDQIVGVLSPSYIDYFPIGATYTLQESDAHGTAKISLGVTAGTRGLGSDLVTVQENRYNATQNFFRVNLDASFSRELPKGFQGFLRLDGQLADNPLVAAEQFAGGGLSSVRGYLQAEAIGDQGLSGGLELRSPSLARFFGGYVDELRVYTFLDGSVVQVLSPLPEQTDFYDLYSAGIGIRLQILKHLSGEANLAFPLTDGPTTRADRPRAAFSVKTEF